MLCFYDNILLFPSGINIFLDGYVPTENLRFRETSLVFKVAETAAEEEVKKMCRYQYPNMKKSMGDFKLSITEGEFTDSEIMVMLGENGETREALIPVKGSGGDCDLIWFIVH